MPAGVAAGANERSPVSPGGHAGVDATAVGLPAGDGAGSSLWNHPRTSGAQNQSATTSNNPSAPNFFGFRVASRFQRRINWF